MHGSAALKSAAICIGLGAVPFSVCLYRLGEDIVSPNFLAYLLIATPAFVLLFGIVVFVYGSRYGWAFTATCVALSLCMCVPLETAAYVASNWNLRRNDLGLPFMLLLLSIWAVIVGLLSALLVWVLQVLKENGRDLTRFFR